MPLHTRSYFGLQLHAYPLDTSTDAVCRWSRKNSASASSSRIATRASPPQALITWHGSYVWDESTPACGDNDSNSTYSDTSVEMWEQSSNISKKTPLANLKGTILEMRCFGEEDVDLGARRELLLDNGDGKALLVSAVNFIVVLMHRFQPR